MDKVKDEVVVKCIKCSQEMITGQKFCTECGAGQDVPMKTREEVAAMRKELFKIRPSNPKHALQVLMIIMVSDTVLSWVVGNVSDQKLLELVRGLDKEGGE